MKRTSIAAILTSGLTVILLAWSCTAGAGNQNTSSSGQESPSRVDLEGWSTAYFASGCFWCVEAIFESVKGVKEAVSGYAGGKEPNPTYQQVSAGLTGHAEAVKVYYDASEISYHTLLEVYYGSHNPTTVDGQNPDYGRQYRSIIFYQDDTERMLAEAFRDSLDASGEYRKPIATEIVPFEKFWEAEDYHQDYEKRNPNNSYVQNVSIPRLRKFQRKYPELLKEE